MVAVAAFVAFLIGLIVYAVKVGLHFDAPTLWLFLGLTLLSLSRVYDRPLNRA